MHMRNFFGSRQRRIAVTVITALLLLGPIVRAEDICREPAPTEQGPLIGMDEDGVCAYKGVPFASPPTGDLRWRPPRPPEARDLPFEATSFGPQCAQIPNFASRYQSGTW